MLRHMNIYDDFYFEFLTAKTLNKFEEFDTSFMFTLIVTKLMKFLAESLRERFELLMVLKCIIICQASPSFHLEVFSPNSKSQTDRNSNSRLVLQI